MIKIINVVSKSKQESYDNFLHFDIIFWARYKLNYSEFSLIGFHSLCS